MEIIEMFTWLNKQGVESDRGFVVQFTGRFTAEYREAGRTITLRVEDGISGNVPSIILSPQAFEHWDNEPPGKKIPGAEQQRLLKNFRDACEFQGLKVVLE
jgi:hypothetical protein